MRRFALTALALSAAVTLSLPAAAQQQERSGWGQAIDQLNRAVNPNSYPDESREQDNRRSGSESRDRRYEGSGSGSSAERNAYSRYSDRELRDRYERLADDQRSIQRERRAIEDELDRRGARP